MSVSIQLNNSRNSSLDVLYNLLATNSLDDLRKSHDLFVKYHQTESLAILHYGKLAKTKQVSETDSCRGLIIETFAPYKVVSRGFDRFIPRQEDLQADFHVKKATVKEDGSLMFLFKYKGQYLLSTMYDFADQPLALSTTTPPKTYTQLFMEIINQPLQEFAEMIINQFPNPEEIMTLCFEMCSLENRVIKPYNTPTLFLTSVYGGTNGYIEYDIPEELVLFPNVRLVEQISFPSTIKLLDAYNLVEQIVSNRNDIMFEGLVLQNTDGRRVKIKNKYYYTHHLLKYKGWTRCTPELIAPLIFEKLDEQIISNVVSCLPHDKFFSGEEMRKRRDYYKKVIDENGKLIYDAVEHAKNNDVGTKQKYIECMKEYDLKLFQLWNGLFFALFNNNFDLSIYPQYFQTNIKNLFPQKRDIFLSQTHQSIACKVTPETQFNLKCGRGIGSSPNMCHCGNPMKLTELRTELTRYRTCHCGESYDFLTYHCWTNIMTCTNPQCICTHEVNPYTKLPLGIPASTYCKNLRLEIHEKMTLSELSKDECYDKISKITGRSREDTHMARFDIGDCVKVLQEF